MKLLALLFSLPALAQATGYLVEGGDLRRSNRAQAPSSIQGPVREQWSATMTGAGHPRSHPLVLNDRVIAVTDGRLAAFDRLDGRQLWSVASTNTGNTGTVDPQRGLIYLMTTQGSLVAYRSSDGSQAWYHHEPSAAGIVNGGSCTLADGKLIFGTAGKGLVAIDPDTRAELWRWNGGTSWTSAAYENGRVYAASANGSVVCLNSTNGQQIWHRSTPGSQYSTNVTLGDELLYVMNYAGKVEARRRSDGSLAWSYATTGWSMSNLALCGDILVVASDDRFIYGVDARTGAKRWSRSFWGNFAEGAPIVVCGVIFVTGCTGEYYALDGKNGDVLWTYNHDVFDSFVDWAVDGDQLFVMDRGQRLHCFVAIEPGDPSDCVCELQPKPTPVVTVGPCPDATDGRLVLWLDARVGVETDVNGKIGNWKDLSGLGHHAVNGGNRRPGLSAPDAQGQRWVDFDGLDDLLYVNQSNKLVSQGNNFTLVAVLKPNSNKNIERFMGSWDRSGGAQFWLGQQGGKWKVGDYASSVSVVKGVKQTVSLRVSPSATRLQVNGTQVWQLPYSQAFDADSPWMIGRQYSDWHDHDFRGSIAQILVYNGVLSDAELAMVESCLPQDPANMPTRTPSPTVTASLTASATASATPTPSPSSTVTVTATPTASPTSSASTTASPTSTPTATHTPYQSPTNSPTVTVTSTPAPPKEEDCAAKIEQVVLVPNPWNDSCERRHCKIKLACSVDKVEVELYSSNGTRVCSVSKVKAHIYKGDWLQVDFPEHLKVSNGTYYCKVTAYKGISKDSKTKALAVVR